MTAEAYSTNNAPPKRHSGGREFDVDTVLCQFLAPMLLNEVQKQYRQIEQKKKTIEALNKMVDAFERRIQTLEGQAANRKTP